MPTYDFICFDCGYEFSIEHGMHDPHPGACPECRGVLHRKCHTLDVVYKRAGFKAVDKRLEVAPDDYDPDVD